MTTAAADPTEIGESHLAKRAHWKKLRRNSKRMRSRSTTRRTASFRTGKNGDRAARNADSEKSSESGKLWFKPRRAAIPARSCLNGAGVAHLDASRICRTKISKNLIISNGSELTRQSMTTNDSIINFLKVILSLGQQPLLDPQKEFMTFFF